MPEQNICFLSAIDMLRKIRSKELSTVEVMSAHLEQIARVNPKVNAIVTLVAEQAMDYAVDLFDRTVATNSQTLRELVAKPFVADVHRDRCCAGRRPLG